MRWLFLLLLLLAPGVAGAQSDYMQWPTLQGAGKKRPVFQFTAPGAGEPTLTATTGQTITCSGGVTSDYNTSATAITAATSGKCHVDYRGLRAEGASSNGNQFWADLSQTGWWSRQHITSVTANSCVFADGTTSMAQVTATDSVGAILHAFASPGTNVFLESASFSAPSGTKSPSLTFEFVGGSSYTSCSCQAEQGFSCSASASGADCVATLTSVSTTPVKMTLAATTAANPTTMYEIIAPGTYNNANNAGAVVCMGGASWVPGATFSTSPIPTTTVAGVARSLDLIDVGAITLSTTPSFSAKVLLEGVPASGSATLKRITDGTNYWNLSVNTAGQAVCTYNGTSTDTTSASVPIGTATTVACSYNGSRIQTCIDGVCHQTSASFTPVTAFTHLYLGSDGTANALNGFIQASCAAKSSSVCATAVASAGSIDTTGLVYWYDATNADGSNDGTLTNGQALSTWVNRGSGGNGSGAIAPMFVTGALNGHPAINFDGATDAIDVASSQAGAAFLHNSGVFDLFMLVQSNRYLGGDPLLQSADTVAGHTGMALTTDYLGKPAFTIYNSGAVAFTHASFTPLSMFGWHVVEVVGTGTTIGISVDGGASDAATFGSLPAGNSTADLFIGEWPANAFGWNGDVEEVLIYNRQLDATTRASVLSWLRKLVG